jgi:lysyl-tRNA synthetase class 1
MFWAEQLLEGIKGPQIINDSWTPSGIVHMGSLKGPVIHDTLYKMLKERGQDVQFLYGFDDMDPIDGLPQNLQESHNKYLGIPIFIAPSPDGNGSFGDYFGNKMKSLLDNLDIVPTKLYRTSELYKAGEFNKAIEFVLENAEAVRNVYEKIYNKKLVSDWYPLQVICPQCGKLGTTKVTRWDGKEVFFECKKDLVKWAQGCGTTGKMSPFNGTSKMPWKVEWAAKWWTFGVTIEGAGKDHASAGGSYDVAMQLISDVFKKPQPLKLGYEFFLSGGKKMSSSKGLGLTGEELLEVLGPERSRFLMIKTPPQQAVEFNPFGTDTIPRIFDEYQTTAISQDEDDKKIFHYSQIGDAEKVPSIRFSTLAQWVQMPNMEEEIKKEHLEEWATYANVWIKKYAPEQDKFLVQKELPKEVSQLSDIQKKFLQKVSQELDKNLNAEDFQKQLYEWSKEIGLSSKDAFTAIYLSLIGKNHGPKAGWFILSLDKNFVKKRLEEIGKTI